MVASSIQSNRGELGSDWHTGGDYVPARLFRDLAASFEELRKRNQELQESNARLQSELRAARERIDVFESSGATTSELCRFAMTAAAQMVERAAETVETMRQATLEKRAGGFAEARMRALELQMQALSLLDEAREESDRRVQEADQKAIEVLRKTRDSISVMAEGLEKGVIGHCFPEGFVPYAEQPTVAPPSAEGTLSTSTELVVSPFRDLASLLAFFKAARQLPGLGDSRIEALDGDALCLTFRSSGSTSLVGALLSIPGFRLRLVAVNDDRIELAILDTEVMS